MGYGAWAQTPNPQSPIPNPQSPIPIINDFILNILNIQNYNYKKNRL
jgi:hypothetical protein